MLTDKGFKFEIGTGIQYGTNPNPKWTMEKTHRMIDDLIVLEKSRDRLWKEAMHDLHRDTQTLGDSAMLEHLRNLKKLVETEFQEKTVMNRIYASTSIPDDA